MELSDSVTRYLQSNRELLKSVESVMGKTQISRLFYLQQSIVNILHDLSKLKQLEVLGFSSSCPFLGT